MKYSNFLPLPHKACYHIVLLSFFIVIDSCKCNKCADITNIVLTNRSPNCKDYVGKYCAKVTDINRGVTFKANFSIERSGSEYIWITEALPNHDFNDDPMHPFPRENDVKEQNDTFRIVDNPKFAPTPIPISLDYYNAILLNGALVDLLSDGCCCDPPGKLSCGDGIIGCTDITNPWRKDPMSPLAGFFPDSHNAHSQGDGTYHYHGDPKALYNQSGTAESPVIGFAADGFPIYGPYINDRGTIRKVRSSYVPNEGSRPLGTCPGNVPIGVYIQDYHYQEGTGDLDSCNGMTRNGQYAYYLTETYPYIIKYFRGIPHPSFKKRLPAPR